MTNVVAFKPRPRSSEPPAPALPGLDLRAHLEDAAQTALDAAEKIMAALDHIDGGDGATPPLAATIVGHVETVGEGGFRYRYATEPDREEEPAAEPPTVVAAQEPEPEAPETAPEEPAEPEPAPEPTRLPWNGAGNIVAAAGCAIITLVVGAA